MSISKLRYSRCAPVSGGEPRMANKILPLLMVFLIAASAESKIYVCTDDDGKVKMQDSECLSTEKSEEILLGTPKNDVLIAAGNSREAKQEGKNRIRNAHFDSGLEFWEFDNPLFGWTDSYEGNGNGSVVVRSLSETNPKTRHIYEAVMSQCVKLEQGRRYRFAGSFNAKGEHKSGWAYRAKLSWYPTDDCSGQSQSAGFLVPKPNTAGWQRIVFENELRPLNAKTALIEFVQSRVASSSQEALWDDIELTPTEMEDSTNTKSAIGSQHTLPIGQSYILNGDFEFDLENWRYGAEARWASSEGTNASGAARVSASSDGGYRRTPLFYQCINFGANKKFRAGARVKVAQESTQQGSGVFGIVWAEKVNCEGRTQADATINRVTNITGWQELAINDLEVPPGAQSLWVNLSVGVRDSGLFAVYFDDVFLEAVAE